MIVATIADPFEKVHKEKRAPPPPPPPLAKSLILVYASEPCVCFITVMKKGRDIG
jgi:hypothetical protein